MSIRAMIFDLFGVLFCPGDLTECRAIEARLDLPDMGLQETMLRSPLFREAIYGRAGEAELWSDVALTLGLDPQEWSLLASAFYSSVGLNTQLLAFARTLHPRYKTAILSNSTPAARMLLSRCFHLENEFDTIVISAEVGVTKPHPEIYLTAANRLLVPPQEALYIDDEFRFVAAAQAAGMQGIQFKCTAQAIGEIQALLRSDAQG